MSSTALREASDRRNKENITFGLTSVGGRYGGRVETPRTLKMGQYGCDGTTLTEKHME